MLLCWDVEVLLCWGIEMLRCWGIEPLVISLGVFLGVSICTTIERRKGYREIVLLTPFNKNAFRDRGCTCLKCTNKAKGALTKQKEHQQSKRSTNRMVGALLALASGKAERSPSLTTLLVLPDSNSFLYFRSKTSRKVIVTRTESDRTANGIRSDGERNPIGRRTESDRTADAIWLDGGRKRWEKLRLCITRNVSWTKNKPRSPFLLGFGEDIYALCSFTGQQ